MSKAQYVSETELAALAKTSRETAGKTQSEAARELKTSRQAIHNAESFPELSLTKLRCRMIETYSKMKVSGPFYRLEEK